MEETRPGEYFKVEESEHGSAILSSKELCAIEFIDKIAEAGVYSFKVEGRMRTPFYTGTVINAYKMAMNKTYPVEMLRAELDTVSHRPFTTGFYLGDMKDLQSGDGGYVRDYLFVATVIDNETIETRNAFDLGDELEVLTPGKLGRKFKVEHIINEKGENLDRSNTPMKRMKINLPDGVEPGDILRKKC